MSNSYTNAAFGLTVTGAEADLLRRVVGAVDLLDEFNAESGTREADFAALGADFAAIFPPSDDDPFAGLLALFPDPDFPYLDLSIDIGEANDAGAVPVFLSGEQFGVEIAANLIQCCARSALPFGFEWSSDCDRMRAGEFGGGYVAITADDIEYGHTSRLLDRALARRRDEGADGFVLAARHPAHGLGFWNTSNGFGRLAEATLFSEAEVAAARFEIPYDADRPEWLAMPAPLRL